MGNKKKKSKSQKNCKNVTQNESEGAGATPATAKKKIETEVRTYSKIAARFKCSKAECARTWSSVHAWERDEDMYCELCGGKADVKNFLDEDCELDNYDCTSVNCGDHWQSLHSGNPEECYTCGAMVLPNKTQKQKRFGRHFWFVCKNDACGVEWEDFSTSTRRTQRCGKCLSTGHIVGMQKVHLRWNRRERQEGGGDGPLKRHNWECCDMCQDLKGRGIESCLKFRKIKCNVESLAEGIYVEKIVSAV